LGRGGIERCLSARSWCPGRLDRLALRPGVHGQPGASPGQHGQDLLDLLFVTRRIPAWSSNLATRAVATPKLLLTDSGFAAHLTGLSLRRARQPTAPVGRLIETFVLGELARQITLADQPVRLYHYRDPEHYG
jgi:hypothetical protein